MGMPFKGGGDVLAPSFSPYILLKGRESQSDLYDQGKASHMTSRQERNNKKEIA